MVFKIQYGEILANLKFVKVENLRGGKFLQWKLGVVKNYLKWESSAREVRRSNKFDPMRRAEIPSRAKKIKKSRSWVLHKLNQLKPLG